MLLISTEILPYNKPSHSGHRVSYERMAFTQGLLISAEALSCNRKFCEALD
jgi:hypothetical protein